MLFLNNLKIISSYFFTSKHNTLFTFKQATGSRGVFLVYPPGRKFFENTLPGNFGHSRCLLLSELFFMNFVKC